MWDNRKRCSIAATLIGADAVKNEITAHSTAALKWTGRPDNSEIGGLGFEKIV